MPTRISPQDQPRPSSSRRGSRTASGSGSSNGSEAEQPRDQATDQPPNDPNPSGDQLTEEPDIAGQLNFRDAQTALELSLAELQAPDLDVEQMAGLYRLASRYADRCEHLLQQVEQEVMQWDPAQPEGTPQPYQP